MADGPRNREIRPIPQSSVTTRALMRMYMGREVSRGDLRIACGEAWSTRHCRSGMLGRTPQSQQQTVTQKCDRPLIPHEEI
jgi:hypothetical protein